MTVHTAQHGALDHVARRFRLAERLEVLARIELARDYQRCELDHAEDHVLFHTNTRTLALVEAAIPSGPTLAPWPVLALDRPRLSCLAGELPLIWDRAGVVSRWRPPMQLDPVARVPASETTRVWELPANELLVSVFARDTSAALFVTERMGAERWRWSSSPAEVVMLGGQLVCSNPIPLSSVDLATGAVRWEYGGPDDVFTILGIVDDVLWLGAYRRLIGLDVATGREHVSHALPVVTPSTTIDDRGWLHDCGGIVYTVYDLCDRGRCVATYDFELTDDGPTLASRGLPCADGRLVFFDQRAGLWIWSPDRPAQPELVWRGPAPVFTWTIAHERIYAVDELRTLYIFGAP